MEWNQPTIFHPGRTAEVSLKCLLSCCVLLFLRRRLSRIDGVLTYNDSTGDLHRLCQIPANHLCQSLSDWHSHRGTSASFSSFLVKFSFCTGNCVSTDWPNLHNPSKLVIVARLTLFIEDFVVIRDQVTKLFCAPYFIGSISGLLTSPDSQSCSSGRFTKDTPQLSSSMKS